MKIIRHWMQVELPDGKLVECQVGEDMAGVQKDLTVEGVLQELTPSEHARMRRLFTAAHKAAIKLFIKEK